MDIWGIYKVIREIYVLWMRESEGMKLKRGDAVWTG